MTHSCRRTALACSAALFVISISMMLLVPVSALALTGDEWVFSDQLPVSPDDLHSQQTAAIDSDYVVWQGKVEYNGSAKDRIFFKDMNDPGAPAYVLSPPSSVNVSQSSPVISGNLVAWLEGGTTNSIHYT